MTWAAHLDTAAVCAVLTGAAAFALPARIAALPEPAPVPEPTPEEVAAREARRARAQERAAAKGKTWRPAEPEPPKVPYSELGARPRLGWRLAAMSAVGGLVAGLALGWSWPLLLWVLLAPLLAALAYIDWNTRLLPVQLVYPAYAVAGVGAVVATVATGDLTALVRAVLGALIFGFVYFVLWFVYPAGMGFGDVRLSAVLGLALGYLGWGQLTTGLYAGFLLGGFLGALLRVTRLVPQRHIPFGPFMVAGALVGVLWGQPIWNSLYGG